MVLRTEEEKGKYAYDFTNGFKQEKKKEHLTSHSSQPRCSIALLFNIICATSPSSRGPIFSSFEIRIKDICDTMMLYYPFTQPKKEEKLFCSWATLNERFCKINLRGRNQVSYHTTNIKAKHAKSMNTQYSLYINQQCQLSESLKKKKEISGL